MIAASCTGRWSDQIAQRLLHVFGVEYHLLPHGERRGVVIDPDGEELHAPKKPCKRNMCAQNPKL